MKHVHKIPDRTSPIIKQDPYRIPCDKEDRGFLGLYASLCSNFMADTDLLCRMLACNFHMVCVISVFFDYFMVTA